MSQDKASRVFDLIQGSIKALESQDSRLDPERLSRIPHLVVALLDIAKKRIDEKMYASSLSELIPQLVKQLWKAVLLMNQDDWIMMSLNSHVLEKELQKTCLFVALDMLKHDVLQKTIAKDLIPITAERIESLVMDTDLMKKELDMNGTIQPTKGNQLNRMVLTRIKTCVELALEIKSYPNSPLSHGSPRSPMSKTPLK